MSWAQEGTAQSGELKTGKDAGSFPPGVAQDKTLSLDFPHGGHWSPQW